jgi:hypothetical protein
MLFFELHSFGFNQPALLQTIGQLQMGICGKRCHVLSIKCVSFGLKNYG